MSIETPTAIQQLRTLIKSWGLSWLSVIYILLVVVGIGWGVYAGYKVWTLGSRASDWEIQCLNGQEYLMADYAYKSKMAPHIKDGQFVTCSGGLTITQRAE